MSHSNNNNNSILSLLLPLPLPLLLLRIIILQSILFATGTARRQCSRCNSKRVVPPFEDLVFYCFESDNIGNTIDFIRTPPQGLLNNQGEMNSCNCLSETRYPNNRCCTLNESGEEGNGDAMCMCEACFPPDCPANKCDYAFQCGTTLYICWNLVNPNDLGLNDFITPAATTEREEEAETTVVEEAERDLEIEELIYCNDSVDNLYFYIGDQFCDSLCSPTALAALVDQDDPNNSNVIGIQTCPNGETVNRYIKFCTPPNTEGEPTDGLSFKDCPDGEFDECIFPFCDYDNNNFTVTSVPPTTTTTAVPSSTTNQTTATTTTTEIGQQEDKDNNNNTDLGQEDNNNNNNTDPTNIASSTSSPSSKSNSYLIVIQTILVVVIVVTFQQATVAV